MAGKIPNIREAIKSGEIVLRKDIQENNIDFSKYVLEFDDAIKFNNIKHGRNIHTQSYRAILKEIKSRINGNGHSIYIIDSDFGGGKTHFFINLYNDIRSMEASHIIAVDGHNISNKTLWGELSKKIDNLPPNVKKHFDDLNNSKIVPNLDDIKLLFSEISKKKFVILMLDELIIYLKKIKGIKVGGSNLADLTLSFLHTLSVAISNSISNILIISTSGNEETYNNEVKGLKAIFSRQAPIFSPIELTEVAPIVKAQLFDNIDPNLSRRVATTYREYTGCSTEDLVKAYPFHPELIRLLWQGYGQIPGFQKIRGILRLLSMSLNHSLDDKIISVIPVYNVNVINEITNKIGKLKIREIVLAEMDRANRIGKKSLKIAASIALPSIINKSISTNLIKSFCASPNFGSGLVSDTVNRLLQNQWYLHELPEGIIYTKKHSLIKLIEDEMQVISESEIDENTINLLRQIINSDDFKLFYFEINRPLTENKPNILILHWNNQAPLENIIIKNKQGNWRSIVNNLILLHGWKKNDIENIIRVLASKNLLKRIHMDLKKKLVNIIQILEEKTKFDLINGLNILSFLNNGTLKSIYQYGIIDKGIINVLKDERCIISRLSSDYVCTKLIPTMINPNIRDLHQRFLTDSSLKILESKKVIVDMIFEGVQNNLIELKNKSNEVIALDDIDNIQFDQITIHQKTSKKIVKKINRKTKKEIILPQLYSEFQGYHLVKIEYSAKFMTLSDLNIFKHILRMFKLFLRNCHGKLIIEIFKEKTLIIKSNILYGTLGEIYEFYSNTYQTCLSLQKLVYGSINLTLENLDKIIMTKKIYQVLIKFNEIKGICNIEIIK